MIHDIYGKREVKDDKGIVQGEEEYIIKSNVKTKVWIDETDIKLVLPQYSEKGKKYPKRLIVTTSTDTYVLNHTFDDLMKVVNKSKIKNIGFKTNE